MRTEHLTFTKKLVALLFDKGISPVLIEHDDDLGAEIDKVFITLRKTDYVGGFYLQIDLESQDAYSMSLRERGHSGGDPTLGESTFFPVKNEDLYLLKALEIYQSALNK